MGSLCQAQPRLLLLLPWAAPGVDRTPRGSFVRAVTATRRQRTRGSMNSPALRGQTRGPRRHVLAWGRIRPSPSAAPAARGQQLKRSSPPADRDRPRCRGPGPDTTIESRPTRRGLLRAEPTARSLPPPALSRRPLSGPRAHHPRHRPHSLRDALRYPDNGASPSGNCRAKPTSGGNDRSRPAAHEEWRKVPSAAGPEAVPRVSASGGCCAVAALRAGPSAVFRVWWLDL